MKVMIWDLPTRLFHIALMILVIAAWVSVEILEDMDLHFLCGYGILGLVTFRLVWGFVGTYHALFASFVKGPSKVLGYLKGEQQEYLGGHNPLGALSVLLLLGLIAAQAVSGLFSDDEYYYFGPLNRFVSSETVSLLSNFHHSNFDYIIAAVGLHLAAIAYYQIIKRDNLIGPMISGYKDNKNGQYRGITRSKLGLALTLALLIGLAVAGIASLEVNDALSY